MLKQHLIVKATYNDESVEENFTDYTLSGNLEAGFSTIIVTANNTNVYTTFGVEVSSVELYKIEVVLNLGGATIYTSTDLETLKQYLTVKATYNDESVEENFTDYTLSGNLEAGISTITVTANNTNVYTTFGVEVSAVVATSIQVFEEQCKTHFIETDTLNNEDFYVQANYNDGSSERVTDFEMDKTQIAIDDTQIVFTYKGRQAILSITVEKKVVALEFQNYQQNYVDGEMFSCQNLKVYAVYLDNTKALIDDYKIDTVEGCELALDSVVNVTVQNCTQELPIKVEYKSHEDYSLSYINQEKEYKISKYTGLDKEILLPEKIDNISVTTIGNEAFDDAPNLKVIKIQNNITSIENGAFDNCNQLFICVEADSAPDSWGDWNKNNFPVVWAFKKIVVDDYFDYAIFQEEVYITAYKGFEETVIVPDYIENYPVVSLTSAFADKTFLKNILLPEEIKEISSSMFSGCTSLQMVEIPSYITTIGDYAFKDCRSIESINIPSSVTSIGNYAFSGCRSLTSITIPSSVTSIGEDAFSNCSSLRNVYYNGTIEDWCNIGFDSWGSNPMAYTENFYMWNGADYDLITEIEIPETVTSIGNYQFCGFKNLTSIIIQSGITSIGDDAFSGCSSLQNVYYNGTIEDWCNIEFLTVGPDWSNGNPMAYTENFYMWNGSDYDLITEIEIPETVTAIGDYQFREFENLTSITIPSSVTSIGEYAFIGCSNLQDVYYNGTIEDWCNIQFEWCANPMYDAENFYMWNGSGYDLITEIEIPKTVTSIGYYQFYGFKNLTSITIPSSVTSIGRSAFSGCSRLKSITIPSSVTNIVEDAFSGCTNLKDIYCVSQSKPFGWDENWNGSNATVTWGVGYVTTNSEYDYSVTNGQATLTKYKGNQIDIQIPSEIDGYPVVGFGVIFKQNTNIQSVTIPNSINYISSLAFSNCSSLTAVTFGETSQLESIGDGAFRDCSSLTSITIPSGVTSMGSYAFDNCSGLQNVYYNGTVEDWCNIQFGWCANPMSNYSTKNFYMWNGAEYELVTEIEIPETVTSIGNYQFHGFKSLTNIITPSGVTSIGEYAFSGCRSLTSITIPSSVTSIGRYAFSSCSGLTNITIPISVTIMGEYEFYGCSSLRDVYYNGTVEDWCNIEFGGKDANPMAYAENLYMWNGSGYDLITEIEIPETVTAIGDYQFCGIKALTSIIMPSGVTSIGEYAFSGCSNIASIVIPNSVTIIGDNAFENCTSLEGITLPILFNDSNINFLQNCQSLENIFVSDGNNLYKSINGNLYSATGKTLIKYIPQNTLTSFVLPSTVTQIGNYAFENATNLKQIYLNNTITKIGSYAFSGCSSLVNITLPNSVTSIGEYAFYGCSSLTTVTLGANSQLESIGSSAFRSCSSLTSITIPSSVTSIGWSVFSGCSSLTSITIPSSVTSIGWEYAFYGCSSLQDVYYNGTVEDWCNIGFDSWSSNPMAYAENFYMWNGSEYELVTEIEIPETVTSIGDYQFYRFENLTSITIPSSVTSIGSSAFEYCRSLTNVIISSSVTSIGGSAFSGCSSLTTVTFGANSQLESIGSYAFKNCSSLVSITIPSSVISIGWSAFSGCSSLVSITIPSSVTSIGSYAFSNCSSLTSITIPSSVTSIGDDAFYGCTNLKDIYCVSQSKPSGWDINWNGSNATVTWGVGYVTTNSEYDYSVTNGQATLTKYKGNQIDMEIPNEIDGYPVVGFGVIFKQNTNIQSVVIPNSIHYVSENAFNGCSSLVSITIPSSVISIGYDAFYGCSSLQDVYYNGTVEDWCNIEFDVSSSNPMYYAQNFYMWNGADYDLITEIEIPEAVASIGNYQFYGFKNLTRITIPSSVTSIGANVFYGCIRLQNVNYNGTIEDWCNIKFYAEYSNPMSNYSTRNFYMWNGSGYGFITEIEIPETVTSIGAYQFYGFENLTSITIPSSVTSIGSCAFEDCINLQDVYYNGTVGDWCDIEFNGWYSNTMYYAQNFYMWNGSEYELVTEIEIPETVVSIGDYQFYGFKDLTSIMIPNSVTSIGQYAFRGCSSLTNIIIPSSVVNIDSSAFESCEKLYIFFAGIKTDIQLDDNWNPDNRPVFWSTTITKSNAEFYFDIKEGKAIISRYLGDAETVVIPDIVTIDGTNYPIVGLASGTFATNKISNLVIGCNIVQIDFDIFDQLKYLETLVIADNNENFKVVNDAIYDIAGKTLYKVLSYASGEYVVTDGTELINSYAFANNSKIVSVTIPRSVNFIGSLAFLNMTSNQEFTVHAQNEKYTSVDGILMSKDQTELICYPAGKKVQSLDISTDVNYIHSLAFEGCSLAALTLSLDNLGEIEFKDYLGNNGLIQNLILTSTTNISSGAFEDCMIVNVTIPSSVTSIGWSAFSYCSSLVSITIPSSVTNIGWYAFSECSSLHDVYYNGTVEDWCNIQFGVSSSNPMAYAENFYMWNGSDYDLITEIEIPEAVTSIGNYQFNGFKNLTSIIIPSSVTSIGRGAFEDCSSLVSITIPSSVTSIGSYAFSGCSSLTTVTFSENSQLESIGSYVFRDCSSLVSITIPSSVTSIGSYAFSGCSSLSEVYYGGTSEQWEEMIMGVYNGNLTGATIYYYSAVQPTTTGNYWRYVDGVPTKWN